jgi:hypothetical protein
MISKNKNSQKYPSGPKNLKLVKTDPNSEKMLGMTRRAPPHVHCKK